MAAFILMYLYYDARGEIKGISPAPEPALESFKYTTIPLDRVEKFLTGQLNPFDYLVKIVPSKPATIVKKEPIKIQPRSDNQFLTEIPAGRVVENGLTFLIKKEEKSISILVGKDLLSLYNSFEDEYQEERESINSIVQNYESCVHLTGVKDPHAHILSFKFNVKDLFDSGEFKIALPEEVDTENVSLYTKKLFEGYAIVRR